MMYERAPEIANKSDAWIEAAATQVARLLGGVGFYSYDLLSQYQIVLQRESEGTRATIMCDANDIRELLENRKT